MRLGPLDLNEEPRYDCAARMPMVAASTHNPSSANSRYLNAEFRYTDPNERDTSQRGHTAHLLADDETRCYRVFESILWRVVAIP